MTPASEDDLQAKIEFITAFFDDLNNKIIFMNELYNNGHRDEARVLCACYIDWLAAALYWPEEQNNCNFVHVLKEYGGQEIFSCIHPKMLERALHKKETLRNKPVRKWVAICDKITSALQQANGRLYEESEIIKLLSSFVSNSEIENIKKELWRGTYAAIVYAEFRIPAVHGLGPSDGITFDNTTFRDQPVPPVEFTMLQALLKSIVEVARQTSMTTGKWFGHDYNEPDINVNIKTDAQQSHPADPE